MFCPGEQAELGVLLSGRDSHWQHIPAQRVFHSGLGVVYQHACIDTAEPVFPLQQKRQVLAIGLGLDFEEPGQALFVEEPRMEGIGGGEAPDRVTSPLGGTPQIEHGSAAGGLSALAHRRSW